MGTPSRMDPTSSLSKNVTVSPGKLFSDGLSFVNRATHYFSQKDIDLKCAGLKRSWKVKVVF